MPSSKPPESSTTEQGRNIMSTVIKDGTIVTADRTYKADVLVENGKITKIGEGLSANETLDATGCYVLPGGIDPHTHLEMPFMGTYSTDDFESGTRAALSGGTTMVVDFCLPAPDQSLLTAIQAWDNKSTRATTDYSFHMASRSSTKCPKSSPRASTPSSISWPTRAR
jgi:dihydropyrimidinase